jgi:hypothetical protein
MMEVARNAGVPLRTSTKYWGEYVGRPYQPAETYRNYSYLNFLEKPETGGKRPYEFFWELWGLGSHRLLLWGDPAFVRRAVSTFGLGGAVGFEIDPPLAQKGFGNRPGTWGIFTERERARVFWTHEFERYWAFYFLWGRLSYDPTLPDAAWEAELERRFGRAAAPVAEAYRAGSGVLSEVIAAHLADPNMYLWPEINPGGLIDSYKEVLPSDWRMVASVQEAVHHRLRGVPSAKQTPEETAARLDRLASRIERAVERVAALGSADRAEWRSSEPDFRVLAGLARYHARKRVAALHLVRFDSTAERAALDRSERELESANRIWERLAELTDGVYPEEMAFGPDEIGHWKDKLAYLRHDLALVRERREVLDRFGRFAFGFDFGGPPAPVIIPVSYRNDPYIRQHHVAARFRLVDSSTGFTDSAGYGWAAPGARRSVALPLTPYLELRGGARNPGHLPHDVLFRDFIRGTGAQEFLIAAPEGEYQVQVLAPDRTIRTVTLESRSGLIRVPFAGAEWVVSGLVVRSVPEPAPVAWPAASAPSPPRPALIHAPPAEARAGVPLPLTLEIGRAGPISAVRLHYRAVNQLARFGMIEVRAGPPYRFTVPGTDVSARWDLMYYFEILRRDGGGWFVPDPDVRTPYFVVPTRGPARSGAPPP